jgi:hypothetical protein
VTASALPSPLAKRIDRLAWHAHAFHRFAHHPLCDSYRGEVLRIGRKLRVCKGCSMLASGFLMGVAAGGFAQPSWAVGFASWSVAVVLGVSSLRRRLPKTVARLLPGAGLGVALWAGWPCAVAALATMVLCFVLYRRRGVERSRCEQCPERDRRPCSGFVLIVRRERAFQRRADGWIARHRRGVSGLD